MKKISLAILTIATVAISVTSCSEYSTKPGKIYMPDMTYSRAYEFYSNNPNMANGLTAQKPVDGTVARGAFLPDHIAEFDTTAAKANKFNGTLSMAEIEEGGRIYNIHCGVCHGNNMDGNGPLYNGGAGKYPAAPANFKDAKYLNMPVGTMYHAIMYGKNLMGSYSSQVDVKQRWQILAYIKKMQAENGGAALTSSFTIADAAPKAGDVLTVKDGKGETINVKIEGEMKEGAKAVVKEVKEGATKAAVAVEKAAEKVVEKVKTEVKKEDKKK